MKNILHGYSGLMLIFQGSPHERSQENRSSAAKMFSEANQLLYSCGL